MSVSIQFQCAILRFLRNVSLVQTVSRGKRYAARGNIFFHGFCERTARRRDALDVARRLISIQAERDQRTSSVDCRRRTVSIIAINLIGALAASRIYFRSDLYIFANPGRPRAKEELEGRGGGEEGETSARRPGKL